MAEYPILFTADMVRAILDGRKTQTRRVVKLPKGFNAESVRKVDSPIILGPDSWVFNGTGVLNNETLKGFSKGFRCPFGQPGDTLWVRETFRVSSAHDALPMAQVPVGDSIEYRADQECMLTGKIRPSIFMPRWASRITLEITGVRAERLQDISEEDARAGGIERREPGSTFWRDYQLKTLDGLYPPEHSFASLWDSCAKPGQSWADNQWVWVITFKRKEAPNG